jgi:phosphoribosylaminoimidazolecarboxamide formyltransferase/IMP cyclohydrolase
MSGDPAVDGPAADDSGAGERRPVRRALLSVYDKTGLEDLARGLAAAGVALVSTGSTAARIAAAGVPVTAVEDLTGFPESLDGRVKTLHPAVHAGLLADTRRPEHLAQLSELGIEAFDLLVGNLYPFAATVASGAGLEESVEQIDIGGPAMVRSAAKNHATVAVVVDPARYPQLLEAVASGGTTLAQRRALAAAAFEHTATYDAAVASWMASEFTGDDSTFPGWVSIPARRTAQLRYGENPHQPAALYARSDVPAGIAQAAQLHGKAMSYNNYVDADAAVRAAYDFAGPCVAVVKHTNPCGLAVGAPDAADPVADAHAKANACDPVSAFGGVVAANRPVTATTADQIGQVFTEVVVAPGFEPAAVDVLSRKRNIRLLRLPAGFAPPGRDVRSVSGGLLVQVTDRVDAAGDDPAGWRLAAGPAVDDATSADLAFAWRACRSVHSNAVLLAAGGATVGIGMGQVNRVDAARSAVARAGNRAAGSVAAGDAFFPFPDGLQVLIDAGVRAVVAPGGSRRDDEVVATAEAAGVSLFLTAARHFRH